MLSRPMITTVPRFDLGRLDVREVARTSRSMLRVAVDDAG